MVTNKRHLMVSVFIVGTLLAMILLPNFSFLEQSVVVGKWEENTQQPTVRAAVNQKVAPPSYASLVPLVDLLPVLKAEQGFRWAGMDLDEIYPNIWVRTKQKANEFCMAIEDQGYTDQELTSLLGQSDDQKANTYWLQNLQWSIFYLTCTERMRDSKQVKYVDHFLANQYKGLWIAKKLENLIKYAHREACIEVDRPAYIYNDRMEGFRMLGGRIFEKDQGKWEGFFVNYGEETLRVNLPAGLQASEGEVYQAALDDQKNNREVMLKTNARIDFNIFYLPPHAIAFLR